MEAHIIKGKLSGVTEIKEREKAMVSNPDMFNVQMTQVGNQLHFI